jgi:succinylglutamic semialdehyde dehydrogenase
MNFNSKNPATSEIVWQGSETTVDEIQDNIKAAQIAFSSWSKFGFEKRALILKRFQSQLDENSDALATMISKEMGKPMWESLSEVRAMKSKVDISIQAYEERCPARTETLDRSLVLTRHFPHGVIAVFGPYNFPGHLPTGHIVPALLAGNTVIFKPSELTPGTGELMVELWKKAGLPPGVINLVQGGKNVGAELVKQKAIRGIFFTGSVTAGQAIKKASFDMPWRILALEMGGNNPLILSSVSDINAAVFNTIQSAFITSGQRCTCARRLIVIENDTTKDFLDLICSTAKQLTVGPYTQYPEPYMGPLVSNDAAEKVMHAFKALEAAGGKVLVDMKQQGATITPGIIDTTGVEVEDAEIFGPLLQVIRVKNVDEAIQQANHTDYGLAAGILSDEIEEYHEVLNRVHAGVINWNTPTTGASSKAPFGGLGKSGNFRPSAFYAADYSAYPVSSAEALKALVPTQFPPGFPKL